MREYLYKAKDCYSGDWEKGCLLVQKDGCGRQATYICAERGDRYIDIECRPETICQFSGYTDKESNQIWENDIVASSNSLRGIVRYGEYSNPIGNGVHAGFYIEWQDRSAEYFRKELPYWAKQVKVIGNIFDHICEENAKKETTWMQTDV